MIAYGYKKIVASSRDIITWVTDQGVPNIWLPIVRSSDFLGDSSI